MLTSRFIDIRTISNDINNTNHINTSDNCVFLCDILPSPPDVLDWSADSILSEKTKLPNKLDLRYALCQVQNQGHLNISAAHSAACMKEWQEFHNINYKGSMSSSFIYNNRDDIENNRMNGREIMKILKRHGVCRESSYNNTINEKISEIDTYIYKEANNFRIKAYARVYTIETLKRALLHNGPCFISFPVFNNGPRLWKAKRSERQKGGTAMVVVGYDTTGFIIRNSWGHKWNKNGHTIYLYEDWGAHYEIWTTIDDTNSSPLQYLFKKETMYKKFKNTVLPFIKRL